MSRLLIGSWAKIRSPSGIYLTRRLYDIYFSLNALYICLLDTCKNLKFFRGQQMLRSVNLFLQNYNSILQIQYISVKYENVKT